MQKYPGRMLGYLVWRNQRLADSRHDQVDPLEIGKTEGQRPQRGESLAHVDIGQQLPHQFLEQFKRFQEYLGIARISLCRSRCRS